jgi:probable rRNA maturation factor
MPVAGESEVLVSGGNGLARAARAMASRVLRLERRRARMTITFLGKAQMRRLNAKYLGHDHVTDVISFTLPQPDGSAAADIYVCRYAAARNAHAHAIPVREEVLRLVVHGTLHILGWDHPGRATLSRSPMWRRQERYMAGYK